MAKNLSEELELKENIVKEDVRIVSKISPPLSLLINRNGLDTAEEEGKHGKQKEDSSPVALHAFDVPNRAHALQPQKKLQPQHLMFFQRRQEGLLTSVTRKYPFSGCYCRLPRLAINCKLVKM